uniref:MANSC domain-containing protein n=1 Tax=Macrostomum lignano TaxID=282301 RepID=A0A1I8IPM8_9PLAT
MILFKAFLALLLTGFHVSLCEKCGPESFVIKKHSIIRTQDSIANDPATTQLPLPPPPQPPQQQPAPTQAPVAMQPQPQLQQKKPASVCRYPDLQFQCRDITKAPHCIAIYDRCDGIVHCGDGSDELSRAPVLAEDQLPNGPDSFLKNPAASRYGLDDATAAELLLRKSADDWGSSDKTRQRWLPASDRSLDYDQLANRLEPETIYNLDKADKAAAALEKSDAADADYYRLGAAAYADRDPDSAPPVSAYDAAPGYTDWSSAESQRRRQRLKQLAASAAAATAAADPPWRPRSSGRAAEIGELDLP